MKLEETTFPFLREDCITEFGAEEGEIVFDQTEEFYQDLLKGADYRDSVAIREHLQLKLFPPMAYYEVLKKRGMTSEEALRFVQKETRRAALVKKESMKNLAKIPFAYTVYRFGVKTFMEKNFPQEGWDTEWVCCGKKEIHFNLNRCIYWDITRQYGCPELCKVYCKNDIIAFSGLLPKIRFERNGTLADGASCCDFHFFRGQRSGNYYP